MSKICSDCQTTYSEELNCCPRCGARNCKILLCDSFGFREHISGKMKDVTKTGKKKHIGEFKHGYEHSNDSKKHPQGVERHMSVNRRNDWYDETVVDIETGEIVHDCHEKLSEHFGHGSARKHQSDTLVDIEIVWNNIVENEGEKFYTVGEKIEFVYSIANEIIHASPVNGSKIDGISKKTIEDVLKNDFPLKSTTQLSRKYRAPSYIFAIMIDKRII